MGNRFCTSWGFLFCHRRQSFSALGVLLVLGGIILVIWFVDNVQFSRAVTSSLCDPLRRIPRALRMGGNSNARWFNVRQPSPAVLGR